VAGGTYFFTVTLLDRRSSLLVDQVDLLRDVVRNERVARPFHIDAWVVLPDHMHCVWTMPDGDSDYSTRWKNIKAAFSRALPTTEYRDTVRTRTGARGIWQRRFWEHTIRDEADYAAHLDYVHLNPYKHGMVAQVRDWPYSSFHRYVAAGVYTSDWLTDGAEFECGE
jgi:putative transposase